MNVLEEGCTVPVARLDRGNCLLERHVFILGKPLRPPIRRTMEQHPEHSRLIAKDHLRRVANDHALAAFREVVDDAADHFAVVRRVQRLDRGVHRCRGRNDCFGNVTGIEPGAEEALHDSFCERRHPLSRGNDLGRYAGLFRSLGRYFPVVVAVAEVVGDVASDFEAARAQLYGYGNRVRTHCCFLCILNQIFTLTMDRIHITNVLVREILARRRHIEQMGTFYRASSFHAITSTT